MGVYGGEDGGCDGPSFYADVQKYRQQKPKYLVFTNIIKTIVFYRTWIESDGVEYSESSDYVDDDDDEDGAAENTAEAVLLVALFVMTLIS